MLIVLSFFLRGGWRAIRAKSNGLKVHKINGAVLYHLELIKYLLFVEGKTLSCPVGDDFRAILQIVDVSSAQLYYSCDSRRRASQTLGSPGSRRSLPEPGCNGFGPEQWIPTAEGCGQRSIQHAGPPP
jgi:hypothetical protein